MAKVTRLGWGAAGSNFEDPEYRAALEEKANKDAKNKARRDKYAAEKKAEEKAARAEKRAAKKTAEVKPSPGISSTESSSRPDSSPVTKRDDRLSPAPTTEPSSSTGHKTSYFAPSADTSPKDEK